MSGTNDPGRRDEVPGSAVLVTGAAAPFTDPDAEIRAALEDASVPTLIAAVVHTTGDPSLLRGRIRPRSFIPNDFQGGLDEYERQELRAAALDAPCSYRDSGCPPPPPPRRETILETMSWLACEAVPDEYVEMFLEEMDIEGADPRRIVLPAVRHSWYKGPDGNVYVLSPWRLVDYWKMTKWPNFEDYVWA